MNMTNVQTLVGWNIPHRGEAEAPKVDTDALLARVHDAGDPDAVLVVDIAENRPGVMRERVRIGFDGAKVRNTHVHGYGFTAGLVVHIAHDDDDMDDAYAANVTHRAELVARAKIAESVGGFRFADTDREQWPGHAFPGGYPIVYICDDGDVICARCMDANDPHSRRQSANPDGSVHFTGPGSGWRIDGATVIEDATHGEYCANCSAAIAEPDAPRWEVATYAGPRAWRYSHHIDGGSLTKAEAMAWGATEAELEDARSRHIASVTA